MSYTAVVIGIEAFRNRRIVVVETDKAFKAGDMFQGIKMVLPVGKEKNNGIKFANKSPLNGILVQF